MPKYSDPNKALLQGNPYSPRWLPLLSQVTQWCPLWEPRSPYWRVGAALKESLGGVIKLRQYFGSSFSKIATFLVFKALWGEIWTVFYRRIHLERKHIQVSYKRDLISCNFYTVDRFTVCGSSLLPGRENKLVAANLITWEPQSQGDTLNKLYESTPLCFQHKFKSKQSILEGTACYACQLIAPAANF